jgi:hypothetical protein
VKFLSKLRMCGSKKIEINGGAGQEKPLETNARILADFSKGKTKRLATISSQPGGLQ